MHDSPANSINEEILAEISQHDGLLGWHEIVLVQREMEFGLGSLAGNDGTTGFALGGRC
jgi:hypothetical protein